MFLVVVVWFLANTLLVKATNCSFYDASQQFCSESEVCVQQGFCLCRPGYQRFNETTCIPRFPQDSTSQPTPKSDYNLIVGNTGNGALIAGILIPLFLIVCTVTGVILSRQFHLFDWLTNKLQRRRRPAENYDEFMIGQDDDDPPLA